VTIAPVSIPDPAPSVFRIDAPALFAAAEALVVVELLLVLVVLVEEPELVEETVVIGSLPVTARRLVD